VVKVRTPFRPIFLAALLGGVVGAGIVAALMVALTG
jgi:hypothetical protein